MTLRLTTIFGLLTCMTFSALAHVQITRLDPPQFIAAAELEIENDGPFNMMAIDFNSDAQVDFRLGYGPGWIGSFFNYPTRIVIQRIDQQLKVVFFEFGQRKSSEPVKNISSQLQKELSKRYGAQRVRVVEAN